MLKDMYYASFFLRVLEPKMTETITYVHTYLIPNFRYLIRHGHHILVGRKASLQKSNYDYQADFKDTNTKTPQQANS